MVILSIGKPTPGFILPSTSGENFCFDLQINYNLVIYFYPRDDTSGCTVQAVDFSALVDQFNKINVKVVGISRDTIQSHQSFKSKYDLKIDLLSDIDAVVSKDYGAYSQRSIFGKKYMGINRSTFLIDKKGVLLKAWHNVKPKGHADDVLVIASALLDL